MTFSYEFPEWITQNCASIIREVNDRGAAVSDFISLALGNPAAEAIPIDAIRSAACDILNTNLMPALQYGPSSGYAPLLEQTWERLTKEKQFPDKDQMLLLLSGSAQGLGLIPQILCRPGDIVYCEEYAFPNFINASRYAGCRPIGIPMDEEGMIPEALEETVGRTCGKILYVNPNFQNPTGSTLPLARRRKIYEIACRHNLVIYEDDPYGDIRFHGNPIESFKQMDTENRVIFAGSYSKTLSAGLRVGYLFGNPGLLSPVFRVRNNQLGQNPLLPQMIISETLQRIDFSAHIESICRIYRRKSRIMVDTLKEYGPPDMKITEPEGGMFVWITFPEETDCGAIYREQFAAGVGAVPGCGFAVEPEKPWHSFRLNYTALPDDLIKEGARRFCSLAHRYIG